MSDDVIRYMIPHWASLDGEIDSPKLRSEMVMASDYDALAAENAALKDAQADVQRICREIEGEMFGSQGAKQPSLCDIQASIYQFLKECAALQELVDINNALAQENAALRADAERYRWLRSRAEDYDGCVCFPDVRHVAPLPPFSNSIDSAVDTARATAQPGAPVKEPATLSEFVHATGEVKERIGQGIAERAAEAQEKVLSGLKPASKDTLP